MNKGLLALIWVMGLAAAALGSSQATGFGGQDLANGERRGLAERYRRFALDETRALAVRTCRRIPRRALFATFSSVDDPGNDNYIALGYAALVRISPIPLQRAAYEGCRRGLRAHEADSGRSGPITGSRGDDWLRGTASDETIRGLTGSDRISGGAGADFLRGGADRDAVDGEIGYDRVVGQQGWDELRGGPGRDAIDGGHGRDEIHGGSGDDVIDAVQGGGPADQIRCGPGRDSVVANIGQPVPRDCERRRFV